VWPSVDVACQSVVRVARKMSPKAEDTQTMNKAYKAYRRIYPAMKSVLS
jgi:sugar (pentulose or hexulose) kinase